MEILPRKDSGSEAGASINANVGAQEARLRPGEIMKTSRQETRGLELRPGSRVDGLAGAATLVWRPGQWCCSWPDTGIKAREQILGVEIRLWTTGTAETSQSKPHG